MESLYIFLRAVKLMQRDSIFRKDGISVIYGSVDLNDVVQTYNSANVFASGYIITDLTGDNLADLNDVIIAYNNSAGFVVAVKP